MKKKLTCILCPKGCVISLDLENGKIVTLEGNKCKRGETYAKSEIENPVRTLTATVLAEGLEIRMVPVKTSAPIPKTKLLSVQHTGRHILDRSDLL